MHRLYQRLGNHAAAGHEIGRSGSTVSKYIQIKGVPQIVILAVQNLLNENTYDRG